MDYPKRDRWGRPLIVPPGGGEEEPFTRVTTIAKKLNGMEGLSIWQQRMAVGGAALRPDILAQVAAIWPPDDNNKSKLDGYVAELREAAAASAGARAGDAFHSVMARVWRGETFKPIPPFDTIALMIENLFRHAGVVPLPEYVERTVVLPELKVAGSFDLLVKKGPHVLVTDLKTGQDLELAWPSIAIQLALYSRAETIYDWDTQTHEPMPPVNQKQGLVIWVPAFSKMASLHVVDLEAGWEAAQMCFWVDRWRKRKDLARPVKV